MTTLSVVISSIGLAFNTLAVGLFYYSERKKKEGVF